MKDKAFLGLVKVRIIDAHRKEDDETPSLFEWAGIENGEEFIAEYYSDGEIWTRTKKEHNSDEYGEVKNGDWFSLTKEEAEIVE